mgnify:CR=1 FL=1
MRKRLVSAALAAAMALSMTACTSNPAEKETEAAAPADTEAAEEGEEKEAAADGDLITVGYAQVGAESDWRTANTESFKSTFTEENGYKLIFDDAQQKQENQLTAIRNFIQQEVDYIVLAPVTETGWDTVLQEAKDAGIPVIIVDRMVDVSDDSLYTTWIGTDSLLEGRKAAEWLNAYTTAKGIDAKDVNIVDIQGTIGSTAQIGRSKGLEEGVDNYGWNLLAQQSGEFTQAKGQEVMESILKQSGDDIDVVYCENDNEAFGAIDALKAAGKTYGKDGDIIIISFDATNAGLKNVKEGSINADFECNPLAAPYLEDIIKKIKDGGKPDNQKVYVDEACFACDDTVSSFKTDEGKEITMTVVDDKVLKERAY